ncbi:T9SS type A sorting domain-containing protein [Flavobacterium sp.]|uniref:T9SS type A sorting domain-containing protein n=1 Tax=Flavobacterium sp. TaxID=239 RepID=UPI0035284BDA
MKKFFINIALLISTISFSQSVVIDNSFGTNGMIELPFDCSGNPTTKSILLSNGKIIFLGTRINGSNNNEVFISRLNSNGTIDSDFGNNGFIYPNLQHYHNSYIKIQTDNKILIYGSSNPVKLIRLEEDGMYDSSFGVNGVFELPANSYHSEDSAFFNGNNLLILNDGKILLRYLQGLNGTATLLKLNQNGTPDLNFGINSLLVGLSSKAIFLGNDNKIIGFNFTSNDYTIEKFNLDGSNDTTFGTNGSMLVNLPYTDFETKYIEQDNFGRFLVERLTFNTTPAFEFEIFRLNNNGLIDTSFGNNGFVNFNNFQTLILPTVLVNNKYYFGGTTIVSNTFDNLIILKYDENGTLDTGFNGIGYLIENTNSLQEGCESINIQTDGKILVSGKYKNGDTYKLFIMRYIDQNLSTNYFEKSSLKIINPVRDTLNINTEDEINNISIIGTDGKLIMKTSEKNIDTSKLSKGMYIIVVEFKSDEKKHISKIVKQ